MKKNILKVGILFLSQIMILAIINACGQLVYATNDDTTMVSLACGGYGTPTEYIINMHYFIGCMLKVLFTNIPTINWITVLFLSLLLGAFLLLDVIIVNSNDTLQNVLIKGIIIDILFVICSSYFTFTVIAYVAIMVGLLSILVYTFKGKPIIWIFSVLVLLLGLMVRGEAYKSLFIIALPFVFVNAKGIINKKNLIILMSILLIMVGVEKSNLYFVNLNDTQRVFFEWGETRSAALDCKAVPYDQEKFDARRITPLQYTAIYNAFYYSFETIDKDVMTDLIELNDIQNKYNFDLIGFIQSHFAFLNNIIFFENVYKVIFYILIISYLLFGERKQQFFVIVLWLMTLGTEFVFFFINRAIYRVVMPNYIFAIIIMLCYCSIKEELIEKFNSYQIDFKKILLSCVCVFSVFFIDSRINHNNLFQPYVYSDERREVLQYMEENSDKIFMAGDARVFSIGVAESVWKSVGAEKGWNLIGNWETYSVPYLELMKIHNIQDPYNVLYEAIDNDNILLLTSFGEDFPTYYQWILSLVHEIYGVEVEFQKVDAICENYNGNEIVEVYETYKLVSR